MGDVFVCGQASQGRPVQPDHLRATKVSRFCGKYSRAALLEDGCISWLHDGTSNKNNAQHGRYRDDEL